MPTLDSCRHKSGARYCTYIVPVAYHEFWHAMTTNQHEQHNNAPHNHKKRHDTCHAMLFCLSFIRETLWLQIYWGGRADIAALGAIFCDWPGHASVISTLGSPKFSSQLIIRPPSPPAFLPRHIHHISVSLKNVAFEICKRIQITCVMCSFLITACRSRQDLAEGHPGRLPWRHDR